VCALLLAGCAGRTRVESDGKAGDGGRRPADAIAGVTDAARIYQAMGLITAPDPLPFVSSVGYFAAGSRDSTLVVVTLSLPNHALTFAREGDRYRATYDARIDLRQGAQTVRHIEATEVVRVAAFKETTRDDESVIFQQILTVAPGQYNLDIAVRDVGSSKSSTGGTMLLVPRFAPGTLSSALTVYEASPRARVDSVPDIVPSPRSTAAYGRDTVVRVYLEGYPSAGGTAGASRLPLNLTVRNAQGGMLWSDTASLDRRGQLFSGLVRVPVSRLGIGPATLVAARTDTPDSARSPLLVSFGDDLPVASFDEMLSYLRYFATPQRLRVLRDTSPDARAAAWAVFLRETDPNPATPQNEALNEYFARLRQANARFRDEGSQGWMSDRGRVYLTLGEPDQVYEQGANDVSQRGRAQIWEYREYRVQLVFIDQTGFSRWRLTGTSAAEFEALARRVLSRGS
jgi:GWxTD domain-containing protein